MSRRGRLPLPVAGLTALAALALGLPGRGGGPPDAGLPPGRPVALALAEGGQRLFVAYRDRATVAAIDTATLKPVAQARVGRRLSDLTVAGPLVLATDEGADELVVLEGRAGALREVRRVQVGVSPVGVRATDDGTFAVVACLWPHRLAILDLARLRAGSAAPAEPASLDLPFAPRQLLALPGGRVLVADAFGGGLAVVDPRQRRVESVRRLDAHNLRGLALDRTGKGVLVAHQLLYAQGRTVPTDIRSGNVVNNLVHRLRLDVVLDPRADLLRDAETILLGDVERGAADPAGLAETADGRLLVAFAGIHELGIGQPERTLWVRRRVGARPTALAYDAARRRAYLACTFDDSIAVVDPDAPKLIGPVRLGPAPERSAAERGEALFYDAERSLEGWYSCHSCHTDGHTSGRLNDNFTDGSFGTPKRVLSLRGTRDTHPWAWNGRMDTLARQVRTSITGTMQGPAPTAEQVGDLVAFLRTLPPPPSLPAARGTLDAAAVERGRKVFVREKCGVCHAPPAYTSAKTYDVGLPDENGSHAYNPPSLRGVSQGGPFFHDGRAATLEEVFGRFGHPRSATKLSETERRDLIAFLGSL